MCLLKQNRQRLKHKGKCHKKNNPKCSLNYDPVCGKNLLTYRNKCHLEKAGVEFQHRGECTHVTRYCPDIYKPVCAKNNKTYDNDCIMR